MSFHKALKVVMLLLWKSWKIRFHYKKILIAAFLLPLFLPLTGIGLMKFYDRTCFEVYYGKSSYEQPLYSKRFELYSLFSDYYDYHYAREKIYIYYTPETNYTRHVMRHIELILQQNVNDGKPSLFVAKPVDDINEMLKEIRRDSYANGIVFLNIEKWAGKVPFNIRYNLVTDSSVFGPSLNVKYYETILQKFNNFRYASYVDEKLLALQAAVDIAHINILSNKSLNVNLFLQHFPIPGLTKTYEPRFKLVPLIAVSFAISVVLIFSITVKRIVEEKSTRVKEYLSCCGVNPGIYWMATHLDTFCLIFLQTAAIVLIYLIPMKFEITVNDSLERELYISAVDSMNVSICLLFSIFFLYCIQTSLFASFLTIFFENANIAAAVSIVFCVLTAVYPNFSINTEFKSLSLSSIFPNCALFYIIYVLKGRHYLHEEMNQFSNLFSSTRWGDPLTVGQVLVFMIVSSILYALLTWYLTEIWPWQKGVPKPWYFPFLKRFKHILKMKPDYYSLQREKPLIVEDISKKYGSSSTVLNKISFSVEENTLKALLGPNGSGKSTLINIICGLCQQTSGNVFIRGNNIKHNAQKARCYIGFCPQHNTYFKYLTVRENLEMIFEVKQELRKRIDGYNVEEIIRSLNLQQFAKQIAGNLSNGVLRRLTLGLALVGPSDILVIDEPTESLDPIAKKYIWDILIKSRESKSIFVCSHQLDEVNIIADKVAVLIDGELKCDKTTHELKQEYGTGYTLIIKKNVEFITNVKIEQIVKGKLEQSSNEPFTNESQELLFHIPFHECNKMSSVLEELEDKKFNLGIESITLFATTMEDIYSRIILQKNKENEARNERSEFKDSLDEDLKETKFESEQNKLKIVCGQFHGLLLKNVYYTVNHITLLMIFIVIPLILIPLFSWSMILMVGYGDNIGLVDITYKENVFGHKTHSFVDSKDSAFINAYKLVSRGCQDYRGKYNNLQDWLLNIADSDLADYYQNFLFGVSHNHTKYGFNMTIWMNPSANNAEPISLNTAMNALMLSIIQNNSYTITLESIRSDNFRNLIQEYSISYEPRLFYLLPHLIIIYSLCYSCYIIRPVGERRIGFKHLQLMTGISPIIFWSANLIFDLLFNLICSSIHILLFYLTDTENIFVASRNTFPMMFLIFFFAGLSQIPFMYFFSFFFRKPSSAYLFISFFCIIIGLSLFTTVYNVTEYHVDTVIQIMCPFIAFPHTVTKVFGCFYEEKLCGRVDEIESLPDHLQRYKYLITTLCCASRCPRNTITWKETSKCVNDILHNVETKSELQLILAMISSGLLYFFLTNVVEYSTIYDVLHEFCSNLRKSNSIQKFNTLNEADESDDVKTEANYVSHIIESKRISHEALVIKELTKKVGSFSIVNRVNLTVRKGECLGLLGSNACGKSTTFKLLTSQIKPTFGNAFINDVDTNLNKNTANYVSSIGYCPQNDALLDCLTGLQTINLFAKLRGLNRIQNVEKIIKKFRLQSVINQKVSTYSGGTRRKLSLALALIGHQKVIFLDEPTSGVDPCSRTKVWQLLRNVMELFCVSILLTSHNTQEVEALCDRIAVMNNGKLQCIGSLKQLREKYGIGFNLMIKINKDVVEDKGAYLKARNAIESSFYSEESALKHENFGVLHYSLTSNSLSLPNIFEKLEELRNQFYIEDYIVSNASLEQNILQFMKN